MGLSDVTGFVEAHYSDRLLKITANGMKESLRTGFSFGLTSAVITTLGLMVGLNAGTHSRLAIFGGILTIAIADAFSDALGVHISEEAERIHTEKQIWAATISTLLTKFVFALSFLVPVLLLEPPYAIAVSVVWGLSILALLSYKIARVNGVKPWRVVTEHIAIALVVIVITHLVGDWIYTAFG
jgi:VIT1/CCC1 family predicted Fe2+/Mn2+ transporter